MIKEGREEGRERGRERGREGENKDVFNDLIWIYPLFININV